MYFVSGYTSMFFCIFEARVVNYSSSKPVSSSWIETFQWSACVFFSVVQINCMIMEMQSTAVRKQLCHMMSVTLQVSQYDATI